nr:hypothetical protein [uncultured Mediterranean phage uvMED]
MINDKFIEYMNTTPKTLKELAVYFELLSKKHSDKHIASESGVDKNVIYRLRNAENITLDNYLKIRNAFPNAFKPAPLPFISELPILGQIVGEEMVQVLNPTQPTTVPVPTPLIEQWKPVYGYLYADNKTYYHGCVHLFTGKDVDTTKVTDQCINRIIMIYPEGLSPKLVACVKVKDKYHFFHTLTKEEIHSVPLKNNLRWAKFLCVMPYSMMEFAGKTEGIQEHDNKTMEEILQFPSK